MKNLMQDDQLIFLISMPRSGSTLLQKILGAHSEIYTRSEPWLMLHALYALREDGIQTRYNAKVAAAGVQDFVSEIPDKGKNFYYESLRNCYLSLYSTYLKQSGKARFLDKTPRYYEVFDELQNTFPNAKFIILYRNPLAVLASILSTWIRGNYSGLLEYRSDLCEGASFLQRDFSIYSNTHTIKYEELLLNPDSETARLFQFLDLPSQPNCINYGKKNGERWKYGDPLTVYEKSRPDAEHLNAWRKQLEITDTRKLLFDYLLILGRAGFERIGYDFEEALASFSKFEPDKPQLENPLSLRELLRIDTENTPLPQATDADFAKLEESLNSIKNQYIDAQNECDKYSEDIRTATEALGRLESIVNQETDKEYNGHRGLKERLEHVCNMLEISNEHSIKKNAELELCSIQLRKSLDDLENQKLKTAYLEETLSSLVQAAEKLTRRKAILHPIAKIRAYKELLGSFFVARNNLRRLK